MTIPRNTPDYLGAQFLRDQYIWQAVHSWLQDAELTDVINLWWKAQNEKAAKLEEYQRRKDDPHNMTGKSVDYVNEYFAKREAAAQ